MNRRKITTPEIENVIFTSDQIKKQAYGRLLISEKNNRTNPLQVVLINTQAKNILVTAFRKHSNAKQLTLDQKFQDIKNQKRKFGNH